MVVQLYTLRNSLVHGLGYTHGVGEKIMQAIHLKVQREDGRLNCPKIREHYVSIVSSLH
jgi:hypothetical protein